MVPNAQPVAPLGAKQVSDAKLLPPVGGGAAATAANNYGTDRLQSHWVSTIPVWLMVAMVGGFVVGPGPGDCFFAGLEEIAIILIEVERVLPGGSCHGLQTKSRPKDCSQGLDLLMVYSIQAKA